MKAPQQITSAANPLVKDVRKAISRGALTSDGCCIAEGFHLLKEAVASGCEIPAVLTAQSATARVESLTRARILELPDDLFQSVAATETTQGVIALVRPPGWSVGRLFKGKSLVVILDGLQDPGNVGTIARAAEAFGATGIIFLKGSTTPFHPKTLRASAGSLFRLPCMYGVDPAFVLDEVSKRRVDMYSAMPSTGKELKPRDVDFSRACAIVVGSEGHGVSPDFADASNIAIPTTGVESLNAAIAASILLYEAHTQRMRS
jgi:TrmH family RNA methyltransferase